MSIADDMHRNGYHGWAQGVERLEAYVTAVNTALDTLEDRALLAKLRELRATAPSAEFSPDAGAEPDDGIFRIGDRVVWESQSAGSVTHKMGVVVADEASVRERLKGENRFIANCPARAAAHLYPNHRVMFDAIAWKPGRVIVEVRGPAQGGKARLYHPRLHNLKKLTRRGPQSA